MRMFVLAAVLFGLSSVALGCGESVSGYTITRAASDIPPDSWDGTYKGTWSGPPAIPGQVVPAVAYVVQVSTTPAGVVVDISADGPHTTLRMRGEGRADGGELRVFFAGCRADDMFACAGYHKGDRLFSLFSARPVVLQFAAMQAPDLKTKDVALAVTAEPDTKTVALHTR